MHTPPKTSVLICPHCGAENRRPAESWLDCMDAQTPVTCAQCSQALDPSLGADTAGAAGAKTKWAYWRRFLVIALLLAGLMFFLNKHFGVFTSGENSGQAIYTLLLVGVISASLAAGKMRQQLRYLSIWGGIMLLAMVGYSYRHEIAAVKERVGAEFVPSTGFQEAANTVSFPVSADGHFYIRAQVNGVPITFLADTGASHIVLSPSDADKLGLRPERLHFDRIYETANGTVRGSSITIDDLEIGAFHLNDLMASVNEAPMRHSLLGMNFFKRLARYEVKADVLTLHW
ncbi:MAG: TIGR02281 family clan AA aspartic protease [Desulfobacterales bacterium]|nr:TIGR02281 family clan AA aspartic protease [Desulfobacterales bacterium]